MTDDDHRKKPRPGRMVLPPIPDAWFEMVREQMKARGLTSSHQLAIFAGTNDAAISRMFTGEVANGKTVTLVAKALDLPHPHTMTGTEDRDRDWLELGQKLRVLNPRLYDAIVALGCAQVDAEEARLHLVAVMGESRKGKGPPDKG